MGVLMFVVMKFFMKIEKISVLGQQDILTACSSKNVELDTYYDLLIKENKN